MSYYLTIKQFDIKFRAKNSFIQAWYLGYGTKDVFESVCHKLNERIAVELDGKAIELPELEGIVLLNIASWSSGCDLWAGSGLEEVTGKQRSVFIFIPISL